MTSILHRFSKICSCFVMFFITIHIAHAEAELSDIYNPYTMSADFYMQQSQRTEELRSIDLRLLAAGRLLTEEKLSNARVILEAIPAKTTRQKTILQILWAKYFLMSDSPEQSIEVLAKVSSLDDTDIYYQCEYHELLALAYQAKHQYSEAALQRMKLDVLLGEHRSQLNNRQKLWQMVQKMPDAELDTQFLEAYEGSEWKGWLALAKLMKTSNQNDAIMVWEKQYPNHPALSIVKKPRSFFSFFNFSKPVEVKNTNQIALLLPLSGLLAGPGEAIKAGFMEAYKAKNSNADLRIYDTNQGGAIAQYHRAIQDGAGIVVGPLTKADVQAVGSSFSSTPTLLLNDYAGSLSRYKYAIGYSPKDEALQLAHVMGQKAYRRVLMIIPASPWGRDIAKTFITQARQEQITVVQTIQYGENSNFSQLIRSGLGYSEYKTKGKNGRDQVHGSRRGDIDAIFMVAYPSTARQIVPLLKYYYAGDVPTFATSAAYDAFFNPTQNKDLDGLYFTDIPWVFNHQLGHRAWPETWNTYSRLYALGYDSFTLTKQWSILQSMPQSGISKHTGVLYAMPNGHVRRELVLGRIVQGVAKEENTLWNH